MIKRRFYKLEHGERDSGSDSSSFSSDSEVEEEASADIGEESEDYVATEASEGNSTAKLKEEDESSSTSSAGLENGGADADADADADGGTKEDTESLLDTKLSHKISGTRPKATDGKEIIGDIPDCMIKCKTVYKCRFCPSVICLNEKTIKAHVSSKRHARSEKLAKEGKLKAILNSDGEVEEQEIVEETHVSDMARSQRGKKGRRQQKNSKGREKKSIKRGESVVAEQRPTKKGRKMD